MVGLVIVSHSAKLAQGIAELAEQMTQGQVPLAVAGGIDDPENPIGTDAMQVLDAISTVYSDDGVVVLMDLGSALLSAETALDFLPDEQRANVFLCAAPVVEGALAAAVQASVGASAAQVIAEAESALVVKVEQLGGTVAAPVESAQIATPANGREIRLPVRNRLGLHARPAARFVSTANRFAATVQVAKGDRTANAKSINQVATLGVRQGDEITVTAEGPDAEAALEALRELADDNFGDRDEPAVEPTPAATPAPSATRQDNTLVGIAASSGVAIGPAALYRPRLPDVVTRHSDDPAAEWARLEAAIGAARDDIAALYESAKQQVGASEADIFEAHSLVLEDPTLVDAARSRIYAQSVNAEAAWQEEVNGVAEAYRALEDEYLRARAADIEDVGQRVLRHLMGVEPPSLDFGVPSILIATDLSPSDTARLDPRVVLALCTELGGPTAHSAILARALGIPAVVGLGHDVWQIEDGQRIAVDGMEGTVALAPDEAALAAFRARREAWQAGEREAKQAGQEPAVTRDGLRVEVAANVGGPNDVPRALEYGAEGVGLFRTEFLFMDRPAAPSEAEQLAAYRQAARLLGERPLIIRTLDVGGDKPLPYLDLGEEANPFLGWRAIRFCLEHPEIFKPQLRAILRAGVDESGEPLNVKVMFPMIGTVDELRAAKQALNEVAADLRAEGQPFREGMDVGIMIEVPSAVAIADQLAREVSFFSIGTNDLTQYLMAADRGNARVADLANAFQPALLRTVRDATEAAHTAGIWIGMCGELAGNPLATPILVGLGLDELSMSAPSIPAVKDAIRDLSVERAQAIAAAALELESAADVIAYLQNL